MLKQLGDIAGFAGDTKLEAPSHPSTKTQHLTSPQPQPTILQGASSLPEGLGQYLYRGSRGV